MEYRAIYTDQEDLEHGLFGHKGSQKKNHKYLLREWVNGKWKYYYTQAQIQAKKLGSKLKGKDNSKDIKKLESSVRSIKKSNDATIKEISKTVKNGASDASKYMKKIVSNGKKKTKQLLNKIGFKPASTIKEKKTYITEGVEAVKGASFLKQSFGVGMEDAAYAKAYGVAAAKDASKLNFGDAVNNAKKALSFVSGNHSSLDRYNASHDLLVRKKINPAKYSKKN